MPDNPEKINTSPYDDGWMIKIRADNIAQLDDLMDAEEYEEYIENDDD